MIIDEEIKKMESKQAISDIPLLDVWHIKEDPQHKNWLIGNGFIKRGAVCIINAPTGCGKSTLCMQLAIAFSFGRDCLGLTLYHHNQKLNVCIIQKEDDEDRIAQDRESIFRHHQLTYPQDLEGGSNITMVNEISGTEKVFTMGNGVDFITNFEKVLTALDKPKDKPDIVFINPLYAYIGDSLNAENANVFWNGGTTSKGEDFGIGVLGLARKYNVAIVIFSHPTKTNGKSMLEQLRNSAYSTFGSSNISNSARSIMAFLPTENFQGKFIFYGAKNGETLGWLDAYGNPTKYEVLEHSQDGEKYWLATEATEANAILGQCGVNAKSRSNGNFERRKDKISLYVNVDNAVKEAINNRGKLTREEVYEICKASGITTESALQKYTAHLTDCGWIAITYGQHKKPIYSLNANC